MAMARSQLRAKEKTISRHRLRRRAEGVADALNHELESKLDQHEMEYWLRTNRLPAWTKRFIVKRGRLRYHYRVVATDWR